MIDATCGTDPVLRWFEGMLRRRDNIKDNVYELHAVNAWQHDSAPRNSLCTRQHGILHRTTAAYLFSSMSSCCAPTSPASLEMGDLTRKLQLQNLTDQIGPAELARSESCVHGTEEAASPYPGDFFYQTLEPHPPIEETKDLDNLKVTSGVLSAVDGS